MDEKFCDIHSPHRKIAPYYELWKSFISKLQCAKTGNCFCWIVFSTFVTSKVVLYFVKYKSMTSNNMQQYFTPHFFALALIQKIQSNLQQYLGWNNGETVNGNEIIITYSIIIHCVHNRNIHTHTAHTFTWLYKNNKKVSVLN